MDADTIQQPQQHNEAPPGRVVRYFDDDPEAMARILAAVAGLRARLTQLYNTVRAGSQVYHELAAEIGELRVIEAQCARALDPEMIDAAATTVANLERFGALHARAARHQ